MLNLSCIRNRHIHCSPVVDPALYIVGLTSRWLTHECLTIASLREMKYPCQHFSSKKGVGDPPLYVDRGNV